MRPSARIVGLVGLLVVVVIAAVALQPHDTGTQPTERTNPHTSASPLSLPVNMDDGVDLPAKLTGTPGPLPAVTLVGTLLADSRAALSAPQPTRIAAVMVHDGERVRHGQLLVLLDDAQGRAQTESAQAGLTAARAQAAKARSGQAAQLTKADADIETAQAGLRQAAGKLRQAVLARDAAVAAEKTDRTGARENVRKAQAALDRARQQLRSLEELAQVGGVARNDLEGARTQVTTTESDLTAAQAQARSLDAGPGKGVSYRVAQVQQDVTAAQEGVTQAQEGLDAARHARRQVDAVAADDIRAADAAVTQAQVGVSAAQALAITARLTSPLDGIATGVSARVGETAQPGLPLVTVVAPAGLHVEALAPARQLSRLHTGQVVQIQLDTRPGRPLTARLTAISQVAEPDGRSFRVRFRLLNPPPNLRVDQSVRILVQSP